MAATGAVDGGILQKALRRMSTRRYFTTLGRVARPWVEEGRHARYHGQDGTADLTPSTELSTRRARIREMFDLRDERQSGERRSIDGAARSDFVGRTTSILRDRFGREHDYLRISVTEKCNLRCTYCMPSEGVDLTPSAQLLTSDEIVKIATLFVQQGVSKIRLTGGEPTVRKDIVELVERLGELRPQGLKQIAMTSNGIALPRKLPSLKRAGLTHLNISLDTLDPMKYELITRRKGFEQVLKSLDLALKLGVPHVKINNVVINRLNEHEVLDFVELTRDRSVTVRFIEYMPFDGNTWRHDKLVPYDVLLKRIQARYPSLEKVADDVNDTTKAWRVPGFQGTVGFITSMTDHFCDSCSRLRITADGNLKVCLFGSSEVSLRDALRTSASPNDLLPIVEAAVKRKKAKHAGMFEIARTKNRPMILIGG